MLRSEKNVTINVRNEQGQLTSQLTVGEWGLATPPWGLATPPWRRGYSWDPGLLPTLLTFDALIKGQGSRSAQSKLVQLFT